MSAACSAAASLHIHEGPKAYHPFRRMGPSSPRRRSLTSVASLFLSSRSSMLGFKLRRGRAPRSNRHPYLFTLITLTAVVELGLTAFLISAGGEIHTWASPGYYSLLILLCLEASWTVLFAGAYLMWAVDGAGRLLANIASSVVWLFLTSILWGAGAGLIHGNRVRSSCAQHAPLSRCRENMTVEALGWTEFSLCCITLFATGLWLRRNWNKRSYMKDSRTYV